MEEGQMCPKGEDGKTPDIRSFHFFEEEKIYMFGLFKKKVPQTCPKCGGSLRVVYDAYDDSSRGSLNSLNTSQHFSPTPVRGSFALNYNSSVGRGRKNLLYRCDGCGYETRR